MSDRSLQPPPRPVLESLAWAVALSLLFFLVYGGCNTLTAHRHDVGRAYFDWELRIPFIPAFVFPYMSIDAFFFLAPFVCARRFELGAHAKRVILAIGVAGVCFLLFPLRTGYGHPPVSGVTGAIFTWFWTMDRPYNLAPSLHIALRSLLWAVYVRHSRGIVRAGLKVWFVLIGLSTLFTHQHHVIDIATGYCLGALCFAVFPTTVGPRMNVTRGTLRTASRYALGALALAVLAHAIGPWGVALFWPIFGLAALAAGYAGAGPRIFDKHDGRLPAIPRLFFAPYLAAMDLLRRVWRLKGDPWNEAAPGVIVGPHPSRADARRLIEQSVVAVLDVTAETTEPDRLRRLAYLNVPVLDWTAPTVDQLRDAVAFIDRHAERGGVYVHCGLGYSRSATVAAAYLLATGAATTVDEAIDRVRAARPGANITADMRASLVEFHRDEAESALAPSLHVPMGRGLG